MDVLTLTMNMREKIKELWKRCFHDSEEFTELYFRLRYSDDVNVALQSGGEVVAALQVLPYPMTFGGEEISTGYISGACTHPDHRNRGLMRELLTEAFARMRRGGVLLSTLIPAEPWLFGYYARSGYAPVFGYAEKRFVAAEASVADTSFTLEMSDAYAQKSYEYLSRKLRERSCCLQHTAADFRVVMADLRLSRGFVGTLNREGRIAALAVAYPLEEGGWRIGETVSDTPEAEALLLEFVCRRLRVSSLRVVVPPICGDSRPLGMARVIHAETMLRLYAAAHPEVELSFCLTDEQLPLNNGYYRVKDGKCEKSVKRLPGSCPTVSVGELAERMLAGEGAYMSLMMD